MPASSATTRHLATVALAGVCLFALLVLLLHILERDLAGLDHTLSEFALGPYGWLMVAAFLAAGLGSLSLAVALLRGDPRATAPAILLGLWGLGLVVSGLVPTDPYGTTDATATTRGQVHNLVGGISFLACGAGLVTLGIQSRKWEAWRGASTAILASGIVGLLAVVMLFLPIDVPEGAVQRVMVAAFLVGLIVTCRARQAPGAAGADPRPRRPS